MSFDDFARQSWERNRREEQERREREAQEHRVAECLDESTTAMAAWIVFGKIKGILIPDEMLVWADARWRSKSAGRSAIEVTDRALELMKEIVDANYR